MKNLVLFVLYFTPTTLMWSQGTDLGTIRGTVQDPSGSVVPNAAVEATDIQTGIVRKTTTNGEGNFEFASMRSGTYKVSISLPGFATAEITNIVLRTGAAVRADATLQPSSTTQSVLITAEAPLVANESTTIAATLDNRSLVELPRDSRDIYSFLYLNPNITQSGADGGLKFIGAQSYGASFSLDGDMATCHVAI